MKLELEPLAVAEATGAGPPKAAAPLTALWRLLLRLPTFARYVLVTGVIGLPASILQLMALVWAYGAATGHVNVVELNALWLINFEMGLLRNYALHCVFTWQSPPTWQRTRHAHVAASGAIVIDIIAFNAVVFTTGIIPLAQLAGAGSGFVFNYGYNSLKTFARTSRAAQGA